MPRFYHVDLAQHVAGADARWVDNLISRFAIPGVEGNGRGASRRLTLTAVQHIALVRSLTTSLGLPLTQAVATAQSLLASPVRAEVSVGRWLRIVFDREEFLQYVDELIADGVEAMTPTRRGRPPAVRDSK